MSGADPDSTRTFDEGGGTGDPFEVEPPANILLLGPTMSGIDEAVSGLINTSPGPRSLLAVSLLRPPGEFIAASERLWQRSPETVAAIGCRSTGIGESAQPDVSYRSTSIADPGDLTGLGIRINECLVAWEDLSPIVIVDSITTILQYADQKRVFRFLHMLTSRFKSSNVLSAFHMDPEAHEEQTIATIRSLFDTTYTRSEVGWERTDG